ncbi:hypothetical protein GC096_04140 [Paenibacillus sp. LMG 31461]|uniref:Butirosin biosynthesis protein H N-terminal domain-containing protein n=1 Tax=Paenibacillus plantarum TaxID=2654975 RepID=A0ABX1X4A5_9BACL|nr:hypothetical protein [Paenibacillus plantarum]NOU63236.1 hypothetical protein [Paenibacillus plantarum]
MGKTLFLNNPIVKTYPDTTYLLSILSGNNTGSIKWTFNNFIQIQCPKLIDHNFVVNFYFWKNCFFDCPLINWQRISKSFIKNRFSDILEYLEYCIEDGQYCYLSLNQRYIGTFKRDQTKDNYHMGLVSGYDNTSKEMYLTEFYSGKFDTKKIPYDEISHSFDYNISNNFRDYVLLISLNEKATCPLKLNNIITSMKDYLNSYVDLNYSSYNKYIYGISIYDKIIEHLNLIKECKIHIDHRSIHFMYEHKRLMNLRLKYLLEARIISVAEYISINQHSEESVKTTLIFRNMLLKSYFSKNYDEINKIINGVNVMKYHDEILFTNLIKILETKDMMLV